MRELPTIEAELEEWLANWEAAMHARDRLRAEALVKEIEVLLAHLWLAREGDRVDGRPRSG